MPSLYIVMKINLPLTLDFCLNYGYLNVIYVYSMLYLAQWFGTFLFLLKIKRIKTWYKWIWAREIRWCHKNLNILTIISVRHANISLTFASIKLSIHIVTRSHVLWRWCHIILYSAQSVNVLLDLQYNWSDKQKKRRAMQANDVSVNPLISIINELMRFLCKSTRLLR